MTSDDSFRSTATTHDELESGITPGGTSGAFRDVLAKDHARRGKPPLHFADMDAGERIERAKALGMRDPLSEAQVKATAELMREQLLSR